MPNTSRVSRSSTLCVTRENALTVISSLQLHLGFFPHHIRWELVRRPETFPQPVTKIVCDQDSQGSLGECPNWCIRLELSFRLSGTTYSLRSFDVFFPQKRLRLLRKGPPRPQSSHTPMTQHIPRLFASLLISFSPSPLPNSQTVWRPKRGSLRPPPTFQLF